MKKFNEDKGTHLVCKLLRGEGVENSAVETVISFIKKLETHSGRDFACDYLKSLSNNYWRQVAGLELIQGKPYVSLNLANPVYRLLKRYEGSPLVVNLLTSLHKHYRRGNLSETQIRKFVDAVKSKPKNVDLKQVKCDATVAFIIKRALQQNFRKEDIRKDILLEHIYKTKGNFSSYDSEQLLKLDHGRLRTYLKNTSSRGTIRCSQESGNKARFFAFQGPTRAGILRALQRSLLEGLKHIHQDCTHDQQKGHRVIQQWLEKGYRPSSVDLSNATDRFPRVYQHSLLKLAKSWIPPEDHVHYYLGQALESETSTYVFKGSKTDVVSMKTLGGSEVVWETGQPLGLPHSFPLFALAHHSLVKSLGIQDYVLLGDDIVIAKAQDTQKYLAALQQLGVEISAQKTFISDDKEHPNWVVQFAGKTMCSRTDQSGRCVIKTYQPIDPHTWDKLNLIARLERGLSNKAIKKSPRVQTLVDNIGLCVEPSVGVTFRIPTKYNLAERTEAQLTFNEYFSELTITKDRQLEKVSLHSAFSSKATVNAPTALMPGYNDQSTSVDWDLGIPKVKPVDILVKQLRDKSWLSDMQMSALRKTVSRVVRKDDLFVAHDVPEKHGMLHMSERLDGAPVAIQVNPPMFTSDKQKCVQQVTDLVQSSTSDSDSKVLDTKVNTRVSYNSSHVHPTIE